MRAEVVGAGGAEISLSVGGARHARPLVLVHGWAQSSHVWAAQFADPALAGRFRLIAMDLRGHGASDAPAGGYDDSRIWADDLAAVLEFAGPDPIVVAWSYGGLVLTDYLRVHGSAHIGGIVLAGALTEIGKGREGGRIGDAMRAAIPAALSADPEVAVPALTEFSTAMAAKPVPGPLAQALLGSCLSVPPSVRSAMFRRDVESAEVLAAIDKPCLIVHGTNDRVVAPAAAEYAAGKIPGAVLRWFVDAGHLPFVESAEEFNSVLRQFSGEQPK
ncbi:alpha/beta fold hydrolase [Amycolatopsis samaneae]|uniref:Alpha/beta fold hydrolase n=1 Tax=Amycolatopsis samaneae TaxID=664691 RepID=A0ABW5GHT4_9PSEU